MSGQSWAVVRIVVALVAIFAIGMWVGRMTAVLEKPSVAGGEEPVGKPGREWGTPAERKRVADMVSERVIPRYRAELGLSEDQVKELEPFFYHAGREMAQHPPQSEGRLQAIVRFHGRIRPFLSEDQGEKLAVILEGARRRPRRGG